MHIVLGPWYAKDFWIKHPRVLLLDRCHVGNPHWVVSLGWMRDGRQTYHQQAARRFTKHYSICCKPWRPGPVRRVLVLGDFQSMPDIDARGFDVVYRPHPAQQHPDESLSQALRNADMAVAHSTTALVDAVLEGVPVVCTDPASICRCVSGALHRPYRGSRQQFVQELSWSNWHHDEIQLGTAWEHLKQYVDISDRRTDA